MSSRSVGESVPAGSERETVPNGTGWEACAPFCWRLIALSVVKVDVTSSTGKNMKLDWGVCVERLLENIMYEVCVCDHFDMN